MILLIDNYDSFSYNVYQLTASVCPDVKVIRNDDMTVEEIEALSPSHIILSPAARQTGKCGHLRGGHQTPCRENPDFGNLSGASGNL